ncbi:MAG TPA: ATP-binding protein [Spirochaetota bacterium]|nr:ATP-binding protein [Spirochaetota bacterium]
MENDISKKLKKLKLDILYINGYQSVVALSVIAILIAYFYKVEFGQWTYNRLVYELWLPLSLTAYGIKLFATIAYHKKFFKADKQSFWRAIFYFTTTLSGISTGSTSLFVLQMSNYIHMVFIILLISAISSGSVSVLATSFLSFCIFNSLSLVPYIVFFISSPVNEFKIIGYLLILFLFTIGLTAFRNNRSLSKLLKLTIENDLIVEALRQVEDKFRKSFYSGIAPMAIVDFKKAKIVDINDAMLELIEYKKSEIIDKNPYELLLTESPTEIIELAKETYRQGYHKGKELKIITKSGMVRICIARIETFKVNDSILALFMLQDLTERIKYEEELKEEREKALAASQAKARFLASMTHEIRTPMSTILGMANLSLAEENKEEQIEELNAIKESAEYLLNLINDILDLSKLEAGKLEIEHIDSELKSIIESVYHLMELHAKTRGLELKYEIDPALPPYIKTSPVRLKQVIINLVGNAIKFTQRGYVCIRATCCDGSGYDVEKADDGFIEISVSDTGIGIAPDKLDLIFESFTQADVSTFRKYGGTGLGLSISKQIIKAMNGDIKVESTLGKGSNFKFVIPLIKGEKPAEQELDVFIDRCGIDKRILIAEDNMLNKMLLEKFVSKIGIDFDIVENGEQAIEALKHNCYNLVFMDLEMPICDGHEAMKRIRKGEAGEANKDIPIYAMTAHVMKDTLEKCIAEGFNGYITKPVDFKRLKELLEKL